MNADNDNADKDKDSISSNNKDPTDDDSDSIEEIITMRPIPIPAPRLPMYNFVNATQPEVWCDKNNHDNGRPSQHRELVTVSSCLDFLHLHLSSDPLLYF